MHHLDERVDALLESVVTELIGENLHAGESADRDLGEFGRIEVVSDGALGLRIGELLGDGVYPEAEGAPDLVAHLGVIAGEFLDEPAQCRRPLTGTCVPGEHPGHREEAVDGALVPADLLGDAGERALVVVGKNRESQRVLGRVVEVEATFGQPGCLDDLVQRRGVPVSGEDRQCCVEDRSP